MWFGSAYPEEKKSTPIDARVMYKGDGYGFNENFDYLFEREEARAVSSLAVALIISDMRKHDDENFQNKTTTSNLNQYVIRLDSKFRSSINM